MHLRLLLCAGLCLLRFTTALQVPNLDEPLEGDEANEANEPQLAPAEEPQQAAEPKEQEPAAELDDRRQFAVELLRMLHDQYKLRGGSPEASKKQDSSSAAKPRSMNQLLVALGADGDLRRLTDWIQNSFNLASVGELTTQFVVSKLGSVNCAALLEPDPPEQLTPRFLLFNEHFVDVPFELGAQPSSQDCLKNARFDPRRKTIVLIHGYLTGYTLVDGLTNIKNRLLDLNRIVELRALKAFREAERHNGSYLLTEDLERRVREQQHNVIIVDWFQGANPVPRARYIRAAVNAQVVGELIARFLAGLVSQCRAKPQSIELIAHSLGCHVAGFAGKAFQNLLGPPQNKLGKITHLDPVGLCFGRLFSRPRFRLSPTDARETQAVHVSLNLFDNPLDGAQTNFLVNGGRDQLGCGSQSELKNSTTSSVSLLYDRDARFAPCSHVRALSLYEDDLASEPGQCQIIGYRCTSYERFLAGKCASCGPLNQGCQLLGHQPIFSSPFKRLHLAANPQNASSARPDQALLNLVNQQRNGSIAWLVEDQELNQKIGRAVAAKLRHQEQPSAAKQQQLQPRSDRRLVKGELVAQTLDKIKTETIEALAGGWTSLRSAEYKLSSLLAPHHQLLAEMPALSLELDASASANSLVELPTTLPVGGQQTPQGSVNQPLYFMGTGAVTPYCVNYYQFRLLIAESRLRRLVEAHEARRGHSEAHISTGNSHQDSQQAATSDQRQAALNKDQLHLTVKLTDSQGRFFKGFTVQESARALLQQPSSRPGPRLAPSGLGGGGAGEQMLEVTMLLNTTRPEPVRISETVISYYFHAILLADSVEVNYMSNISPEVRARYSSQLCPAAINDKHQLVRYVECNKIDVAAKS